MRAEARCRCAPEPTPPRRRYCVAEVRLDELFGFVVGCVPVPVLILFSCDE